MKRCPYCAEEVQEAAVICRYCSRALAATGSPTAEPSRPAPPSEPPVTPAKPPVSVTKTAWSLSTGGTRRNALVSGAAGVALAFWEPTYGLGVLVIWVASTLLLRGPLVPRILVSMFAAAIIGTLIGAPKTVTSSNSKQQVAQPVEVRNLERQMLTAIDEKKWEQASAAANLIRRQDPSNAALTDTAASIAAGIEAARNVRQEEARRSRVSTGFTEAEKVVADAKLCDTAKAIGDAWANLKNVRREDPEWERAAGVVRRLERCRVAVERTMSQGLRQVMVTQREQWANTYERGLLDKGIDARVTLSGTNKNQVRIQWILISRASTHQITDGGSLAEGSFLQTLQKIGFRRVTFSDGYDDSWTYTLEPEDEANGGVAALAGMGLGQPLSLPE